MTSEALPPTTCSLQEAAELLGVHYMTVYRYVRTGRLEARRTTSGWELDRTTVERLRTELSVPRAVGRLPRAGAGALAAGGTGPSTGDRAARLERRLVAGDEQGSFAVLEEALSSGATPEQVYLQLLGPALASIGARWQHGTLTVADEHRASAVATRLVGRMGPHFVTKGRRRGAVVVASPEGEHHTLPVAMLSDLLRGRRFAVVDLGADLPPSSIAQATARAVPEGLVCVLLGVTSSGHEAAVEAAVAAAHEAVPGVRVGVGGAAVASEEQAARLGADFYTGSDGASVLACVEELVSARQAPRHATQASRGGPARH